MKAYTYENTKTDIPMWETTTHLSQKYGYGYETPTHFIHFYGNEDPLFIISVGLTVIEEKTGTYQDWITDRFGAVNVEEMDLEAGNTIKGIWRPSLYYWNDTEKALEIDSNEQRAEEQAIRILTGKLDELLLYIEPSPDGLNSYSHKTRELLILACTEVENQWRSLLNLANFQPKKPDSYKTTDYVKIIPTSHIAEFQVSLKNYDNVPPAQPFIAWDRRQPTKSLDWYDAYNKTKHNRDIYFKEATLKHTIAAVAANLILYCTRFSPLFLLHDTTTLAGLVKQMFSIKMINANRKTFYLPELSIPNDQNISILICDSYENKYNQAWISNPYKI